MINYRKISEEVITTDQSLCSIGGEEINFLIDCAKKTTRKRFRLCLNTNDKELIHEMFIVHPKNAYVRPHKHLNKTESMFVLKGKVDYLTFKDDGQIKDIVQLSELGGNQKSFITLRSDLFHTLIIHSEWLVFLEITNGPFIKEDTIFAKWSPEEHDKENCIQFISNIKKNITNSINF